MRIKKIAAAAALTAILSVDSMAQDDCAIIGGMDGYWQCSIDGAGDCVANIENSLFSDGSIIATQCPEQNVVYGSARAYQATDGSGCIGAVEAVSDGVMVSLEKYEGWRYSFKTRVGTIGNQRPPRNLFRDVGSPLDACIAAQPWVMSSAVATWAGQFRWNQRDLSVAQFDCYFRQENGVTIQQIGKMFCQAFGLGSTQYDATGAKCLGALPGDYDMTPDGLGYSQPVDISKGIYIQEEGLFDFPALPIDGPAGDERIMGVGTWSSASYEGVPSLLQCDRL
jgi:hypothetical protein